MDVNVMSVWAKAGGVARVNNAQIMLPCFILVSSANAPVSIWRTSGKMLDVVAGHLPLIDLGCHELRPPHNVAFLAVELDVVGFDPGNIPSVWRWQTFSAVRTPVVSESAHVQDHSGRPARDEDAQPKAERKTTRQHKDDNRESGNDVEQVQHEVPSSPSCITLLCHHCRFRFVGHLTQSQAKLRTTTLASLAMQRI